MTRVPFIFPTSLAARPIYEQGEAKIFSNLKVEGKTIIPRSGQTRFRTTDLGGPILGLFYWRYGVESIIAVTTAGIYQTPIAERVSGSITGVTLVSGTTYRYQFSGAPDFSGVLTTDCLMAISTTLTGANCGMFPITAVNNTTKTIDVTNALGVAETATGTGQVYQGFLHPTWDGAGADPASFTAGYFWSGESLWSDSLTYPVMILSNGLASGSGGGNFKLYYTGGALHYNAATCADSGTAWVMSSIVEFKGRLWGNATALNGVVYSGKGTPEDWDHTTGTGGFNDRIGSATESVTALVPARDSLYVFKQNYIFKIIGEDFMAPNDGQVIGPIASVGVSSHEFVYRSHDRIFFKATTGGVYEIKGDEAVPILGKMRDDLYLMPLYPGFREARNELWLSDYQNGQCYIYEYDTERWRLYTGTAVNRFLNIGAHSGFITGTSTAGASGYVNLQEYDSMNKKDFGAATVTTLQAGYTDFTDANKPLASATDKTPKRLYIYGFGSGTSVTVTFYYRTNPRNESSVVIWDPALPSQGNLPAEIPIPGTYRFKECALKIVGDQSLYVQSAVLEYEEIREGRA